MKKIFVFVSFVLLLFAFSASASDQDGQHNRGDFGNGRFSRHKLPSILSFAAELGLTPGQSEKLMTIEKESNVKSEKSSAELKEYMKQMREETEKDNPDENKIDEIINKISDNHKAFMKERFHDILKIKSVLSKEQREILRKKMQQEKHRTKNDDDKERGNNEATEK